MNGSKLYGLSTYFGTKNSKYVLSTMHVLKVHRSVVGTEIKLQDSILWAIGSGNVLILKSGKKSNIQKVSINYCELANVVCSAKNNHCRQIYVYTKNLTKLNSIVYRVILVFFCEVF